METVLRLSILMRLSCIHLDSPRFRSHLNQPEPNYSVLIWFRTQESSSPYFAGQDHFGPQYAYRLSGQYHCCFLLPYNWVHLSVAIFKQPEQPNCHIVRTEKANLLHTNAKNNIRGKLAQICRIISALKLSLSWPFQISCDFVYENSTTERFGMPPN